MKHRVLTGIILGMFVFGSIATRPAWGADSAEQASGAGGGEQGLERESDEEEAFKDDGAPTGDPETATGTKRKGPAAGDTETDATRMQKELAKNHHSPAGPVAASESGPPPKGGLDWLWALLPWLIGVIVVLFVVLLFKEKALDLWNRRIARKTPTDNDADLSQSKPLYPKQPLTKGASGGKGGPVPIGHPVPTGGANGHSGEDVVKLSAELERERAQTASIQRELDALRGGAESLRRALTERNQTLWVRLTNELTATTPPSVLVAIARELAIADVRGAINVRVVKDGPHGATLLQQVLGPALLVLEDLPEPRERFSDPKRGEAGDGHVDFVDAFRLLVEQRVEMERKLLALDQSKAFKVSVGDVKALLKAFSDASRDPGSLWEQTVKPIMAALGYQILVPQVRELFDERRHAVVEQRATNESAYINRICAVRFPGILNVNGDTVIKCEVDVFQM